MQAKSVIFLIGAQLIILLCMCSTNGVLATENGAVGGEEDYTCGGQTCTEGQHCENFLVQCIRAPCPAIRRCVKTTGITCANVRCAGGPCVMKSVCDSSGCRDSPTCVPRDSTTN